MHRPAIIEDKAIKRVSSCPLHPGYAAKRYPVAAKKHEADGCTCLHIWETAQAEHPDVLAAQRLEERANARPLSGIAAYMQAARDSKEKD